MLDVGFKVFVLGVIEWQNSDSSFYHIGSWYSVVRGINGYSTNDFISKNPWRNQYNSFNESSSYCIYVLSDLYVRNQPTSSLSWP